MIGRYLSYLLFVLGAGLLVVAAYIQFAPAPSSCLEIAQQDVEVSDCVAGSKMPVVFHFHNRSSRPIRILGLNQC